MEYFELAKWAVSVAAPVLSVLLGVMIGARLTERREKWQKRHAFMEHQLRDFYSPLLGLRTEIRAKSDLRVKVSGAAGTEWPKLCAEARDTADPVGNLQKLHETKWPEFAKIIDYNNQQIAEQVMPAYRRMLATFRDNLWLADPETRSHFQKLVEFVDIWERWLARAIPHEVVQNLGHTEESLHPFYDHLERKHDELRARLSQGEA